MSLIKIEKKEGEVILSTETVTCCSSTIKGAKEFFLKSLAQQVAMNIFKDGVLAITGMGLENVSNGLRTDAQEVIAYYLELQDELLSIPDSEE